MFQTLLVPLDRSAFAEHALPLAVSIARRAAAQLDLVQVHELYALADPACGWAPFNPAEDAQWKEKERLYLTATANWVSAVARVAVTATVLSGEVAEAILEQSWAGHADLIVLATHGRGPVTRFFLGSVADRVLRCATAPLLVVHGGETQPALIPEAVLEDLLVPLDGSPLAEQVLPAALELARLMEGRCTLLRVVGPGAAALAEAEAYLERMAARLRAEGAQIQTRIVLARHAAEAILEQVRTHGHDLVALATHGRGGARRVLLGSVADKVIRGVSTPVLVYRPAGG
jgi:nucleotide-binding universal stress UspA family protein